MHDVLDAIHIHEAGIPTVSNIPTSGSIGTLIYLDHDEPIGTREDVQLLVGD